MCRVSGDEACVLTRQQAEPHVVPGRAEGVAPGCRGLGRVGGLLQG